MRKAILIVVSIITVTNYAQHGSDPVSGKRARPSISSALRKQPKPERSVGFDADIFDHAINKVLAFPADEILFSRADYDVLKNRHGWRLITESDADANGISAHAFYDPQRVTKESFAVRRAWTRYEAHKNGGLDSYTLYLDEFWCGQKKDRSLITVDFSKDGNQTASSEGDAKWAFVVPDSFDEQVYEVICHRMFDLDETSALMAAIYYVDGRRSEKKGNMTEACQLYQKASDLLKKDKAKLRAGLERTRSKIKINPQLP